MKTVQTRLRPDPGPAAVVGQVREAPWTPAGGLPPTNWPPRRVGQPRRGPKVTSEFSDLAENSKCVGGSQHSAHPDWKDRDKECRLTLDSSSWPKTTPSLIIDVPAL